MTEELKYSLIGTHKPEVRKMGDTIQIGELIHIIFPSKDSFVGVTEHPVLNIREKRCECSVEMKQLMVDLDCAIALIEGYKDKKNGKVEDPGDQITELPKAKPPKARPPKKIYSSVDSSRQRLSMMMKKTENKNRVKKIGGSMNISAMY